MLARTHMLLALITAVLLAKFLNINNPIYFIILTVIVSIIPDIDTTKSFIGKKTKVTSFLLNIFFGHRGLLHSLLVPLTICALLFSVGFYVTAFAILIGYLTHILADSLTIEGIRPFYPLKFQVKGIIRTGGISEHILFFIIILIIILSMKSLF